MKKIFVLVAVASAFSFASCKKDRVCSCVNTSTVPGSGSTTSEITFTKAKKGDAKVACASKSTSFEILGTTYTSTSTCTLK